ncbi:hypothetical protein, partial [Scytonema sp. HK-05]|uniref:hypothetical protein n=1 Tax=Scytonema sp. HK-05 TaxID=1137095 RepID=UPI001E48921A
LCTRQYWLSSLVHYLADSVNYHQQSKYLAIAQGALPKAIAIIITVTTRSPQAALRSKGTRYAKASTQMCRISSRDAASMPTARFAHTAIGVALAIGSGIPEGLVIRHRSSVQGDQLLKYKYAFNSNTTLATFARTTQPLRTLSASISTHLPRTTPFSRRSRT